MKTPNPDSPRALCEEILAEARRQAEQILRDAQQEAEALLAKAEAEAEAARQQRLDLARVQAAHHRELLLAGVPLAISLLRAARLEKLLDSIHEAVRRRLAAREGFEYRETLVALAAEALSQMSGDAFLVKLSRSDCAALGEALVEAIAHQLGRASGVSLKLVEEPGLTEGGLVLEDCEGRQVWDNRLLARLERLWPDLRRGLVVGAALVTENSSAGGGA